MANKIIFLLILMSLLFSVAQAQNAVSENLIPCDTDCGYNDFLLLIKNVFDFLTIKVAIPLAGATIVVGGAIMMTAGSNSGKREEAKKIIWAAVWGLVIVLASVLIVKLVFDTLVNPNSGYTPNIE